MRHWLIRLLVALLCVQACWAVAAAACSHETDPAVTHFGHHTHEHNTAVQAEQVPQQPGDDDCEVCHLGCNPSLAYTPGWYPYRTMMPKPADPPDFASPLPTHRPERPNWRPPA